jgi:hypothetical protein
VRFLAILRLVKRELTLLNLPGHLSSSTVLIRNAIIYGLPELLPGVSRHPKRYIWRLGRICGPKNSLRRLGQDAFLRARACAFQFPWRGERPCRATQALAWSGLALI